MEKVLKIFEQLSEIPRGSGNTQAVSDFCAAYGKERGFPAEQDGWGNVVIRVPGTPGYEDHPVVVIQGHLDMVCEKDPESAHDFCRDGLKLRREGDWLRAEGTTLGADDGIAVAYGLALLEDPAPHPPLELFFTVDEETGMEGAAGFDPGWITGRRMLNLDTEEEGVFVVSSAGGCGVTGRLPLKWERCDLPVYEIRVEGLQGGHSGAEIHCGRGNANILLGKILAGLDCRLIRAEGGTKSNAIPRRATALAALEQPVSGAALTALFRREYGAVEPELSISVVTATSERMLEKSCSEAAIGLLAALPDGVQQWSGELEGLVETSLNTAILRTGEEFLTISASLRSMKNAERDRLAARVEALMPRHGARTERSGGYPAWEYRAESPLRAEAVRCYQSLFQKTPELRALHAGLECGLFARKLPGLDCISFGPEIREIHTTRERLSLSSGARTWSLLKALLKAL